MVARQGGGWFGRSAHCQVQKKKEIKAFVVLLSDFGHRVWILGEVRDTKGDLWARQGRSLDYWATQLWGKEPQGFASSMFKSLFNQLPTPASIDDLFEVPPAHVEKIFDQLRMLMGNLILEDLTRIHFALARVQATLLLTVRNPNAVQRGVAEVNAIFADLTNPDIGIRAYDFDGFPGRYAEKIGPVRLALRRDLRLSSKSLRAVHRTSWVWMASRILRHPIRFFQARWATYVTPHETYEKGVARHKAKPAHGEPPSAKIP